MSNQHKSWFKFLFSKTFFKQLITISVFAGVLLMGVLFYLKLYTNHDNTIELPDYTGLYIEDVDSLLKEQSLRYVVIDSIFNKEKEPGSIVDQDPKPGIHVKENRRIYLTIIAKKRQLISMPYLIDLTHRSAIAKLKGLGLVVGDLSYVPNLAKNAVLKQKVAGKEVKSGEYLPVGTKVDLVLGNGLSELQVELPFLEGLTFEDAELVLQLSSLNIGLSVFDASVTDSSKAVVYRQRPAAREGRLIKLGRPVDIFLKQPPEQILEQ
tara:strand:+ start:1174 stop:1971 length:798 start_codon:yes stop_codon:yes gene_type:complete